MVTAKFSLKENLNLSTFLSEGTDKSTTGRGKKMNSQERRFSNRVRLNHPIMIRIDGDVVQPAEILDAGDLGLRVRVTGQTSLQVGHEVEIASLSSYKRTHASRLKCCIAWQDMDNSEVGLKYLQ